MKATREKLIHVLRTTRAYDEQMIREGKWTGSSRDPKAEERNEKLQERCEQIARESGLEFSHRWNLWEMMDEEWPTTAGWPIDQTWGYALDTDQQFGLEVTLKLGLDESPSETYALKRAKYSQSQIEDIEQMICNIVGMAAKNQSYDLSFRRTGEVSDEIDP